MQEWISSQRAEKQSHAEAWFTHAAACDKTPKPIHFHESYMPQHDSFMPWHATPGQKGKCASCRSMSPSCRGMTPNSAKIKPHDLSLSFTLLNPIPSLKHLQIFPKLQPFNPSQFSSNQIPNPSHLFSTSTIIQLTLARLGDSLKNWKKWKSWRNPNNSKFK